ncbi:MULTISPECIES: hypothetical protein [Hyphomonas]|uniref:hypothetical protein n=1 Tax=Hyphomonas TaxID=85 RepID=UPI0035185BE2
MSDQPIEKLRIGSVTAAIWRNRSKDGNIWYATTILRSYRTKDGWKETASFSARDLLVIAKLTDIASRRILELEAKTPRIKTSEAAA